jgi:hypothetical protein
MGGIGCFISSAITLLVKSPPLETVTTSLNVSDRSFFLDPTLPVTNMITKRYLCTTQAGRHLYMTITTITVTTYPFLKLRISTKTRLKRIYVRFVSLIQYPIQSSSTQLNRKNGNVGIQPRARSHRDTSPTQRVSQCHLLLYF